MIREIINAIRKANRIAILPHVSADGDALGSSLALGLALKRIGKDIRVYIEEKIPMIYDMLPGQDMLVVYGNGCIADADDESGSIDCRGEKDGNNMAFDLAIAIDTGDVERLGKRVSIFDTAQNSVNIDHHHTNTEFAGINYVDTQASAVGEIVYQLIKDMGLEMDADISTSLYVAISTDTGGFRYSNTTPATHRIAADLVNNGIDVAEISQKVFDSTTFSKVRLMGETISSLELLNDGKVAFSAITKDKMEKLGATEEDCDGLVNIGRNIVGVEVSVFLRQKQDGSVKANLRSKNYVDVAAVAKMFGGGGHKRAAGFTSEEGIEDVRDKVLNVIGEMLK